jgi:eukaryotic-like serine/threonine-protein kinase
VTIPSHSRATTRTTRFAHRPRPYTPRLLAPGDIVPSLELGLRYQVDRLLGEGGFGQVYLATRLGRSPLTPEVLCLKISTHIDGWLREAYFGQMLDRHPRAIRVYDRFPLLRHGVMLYALAIEYACHGDLSSHLAHSGKPFSETAVRREIAGVLEVLGKLHRGQMLHRDLTPLNVFVCEKRRLKLGDFGIARAQSDTRGVTARTLNPFAAPSDILDGIAPKWQARDDVYQVGQLLGMLIKGDARSRVRTGEIRHLDCSDHLKEIIHRCIGERRKRYDTADHLIDALRHPPAALTRGRLGSLKGVHLTFTGILSRPRREAAAAAIRAGAVVHSGPSSRTTVVVRGRPNPQQAAGRDAGLKLMEIKRLRAAGHRITLLSDEQFWKLTARTRR